MRGSPRFVLCLAGCVVLGAASAAQARWFVNGSCGDDAWSGSSSSCQAPDGPKKTIQAAMDVAATGDEVLVADGVYRGAGNKGLYFPGRYFTVRSENGPSACTIDMEHSGVAFFLVTDETPEAVIEGFTIRNGNGYPGGAFFIHHASEVVVRRCFLPNNFSGSAGGAVYCDDNASPTFENCAFLGNATAGVGGALAFFTGESAPTLVGCLIAGNSAQDEGGGVYFGGFGDSPALLSSTVAGNDSGGLAGGVFVSAASDAVITNSILWGNGGSALVAPEQLAVRFSDVQGGWPGPGNLDADPLFNGPGYRLTLFSPCIDAGDDAAVPSTLLRDLAGRRRRLDGDFDRVPTVDLGALEFFAHLRFRMR